MVYHRTKDSDVRRLTDSAFVSNICSSLKQLRTIQTASNKTQTVTFRYVVMRASVSAMCSRANASPKTMNQNYFFKKDYIENNALFVERAFFAFRYLARRASPSSRLCVVLRQRKSSETEAVDQRNRYFCATGDCGKVVDSQRLQQQKQKRAILARDDETTVESTCR